MRYNGLEPGSAWPHFIAGLLLWAVIVGALYGL